MFHLQFSDTEEQAFLKRPKSAFIMMSSVIEAETALFSLHGSASGVDILKVIKATPRRDIEQVEEEVGEMGEGGVFKRKPLEVEEGRAARECCED